MTQRHATRTRSGASAVPRLERMRAEDAFFLYAESANVPQVVGGFVLFDGYVSLGEARRRVAERLPGLPNLRRRLVTEATWRRPAWLVEDAISVDAHVTECALRPGTTLADVVDEFYSASVPLDRPPWQLRLVHGLEGGRSALVVKLHHALGDGFAVIHSMLGLLDAGAGIADPAGQRSSRARARGFAPPYGIAGSARMVRRTVTGVWSLGRSGPAPASRLSGLTPGPKRKFVPLRLDARDVRAAARAHRARTNDLLLATVADGLHRFLADTGEPARQATLRAMVPRTLRTTETWGLPGNLTAAVSLDLPVGPMTPQQRLTEIRAAAGRLIARGEPEATRFVVRAMGILPAPVHAWAARNAYNSHWFNVILSVIPGPHRTQRLCGVRLAEVYPVLPVTSGVGLAIGVMRWGDDYTVGFTADAAIVPDVADLAGAVGEAFAAFRDAAD